MYVDDLKISDEYRIVHKFVCAYYNIGLVLGNIRKYSNIMSELLSGHRL